MSVDDRDLNNYQKNTQEEYLYPLKETFLDKMINTTIQKDDLIKQYFEKEEQEEIKFKPRIKQQRMYQQQANKKNQNTQQQNRKCIDIKFDMTDTYLKHQQKYDQDKQQFNQIVINNRAKSMRGTSRTPVSKTGRTYSINSQYTQQQQKCHLDENRQNNPCILLDNIKPKTLLTSYIQENQQKNETLNSNDLENSFIRIRPQTDNNNLKLDFDDNELIQNLTDQVFNNNNKYYEQFRSIQEYNKDTQFSLQSTQVYSGIKNKNPKKYNLFIQQNHDLSYQSQNQQQSNQNYSQFTQTYLQKLEQIKNLYRNKNQLIVKNQQTEKTIESEANLRYNEKVKQHYKNLIEQWRNQPYEFQKYKEQNINNNFDHQKELVKINKYFKTNFQQPRQKYVFETFVSPRLQSQDKKNQKLNVKLSLDDSQEQLVGWEIKQKLENLENIDDFENIQTYF